MKHKIITIALVFVIMISLNRYQLVTAEEVSNDDKIVNNNEDLNEDETSSNELSELNESEESLDDSVTTSELETQSQITNSKIVSSKVAPRTESVVIDDIKTIVNAIHDVDATDANKIVTVEEMINNFYSSTSVNTTLKWYDTSSKGLIPWDGEATPLASLRKSSTGSYLVANGTELAGAILNTPDNDKTIIELENDIDLNGKEQYWIAGKGQATALNSGQTLNGNGYTIYNLCSNTNKTGYSSRGGFLTSIDGKTVIKNLNFENALLLGAKGDPGAKAGSGIIGWIAGGTVSNVHVKNSISVGYGNNATICGRAAKGGSYPINIDNVSAQDCTVFGRNHIGSLTGPLVNTDKISKGWSLGCTVYSTGAHSGGLISCVGTANIEECFTDVHMYGSEDTGVLTGAANGLVTIKNCGSSGFIEGDSGIGGFIGTVEGISSSSEEKNFVKIENCYTTALVGLDSGGKEKGGFVGRIGTSSVPNINYSFTNCYAAGEVGYLDVDSSGDGTGTQSNNDGGFAGADLSSSTVDLNRSFTNCYYDKQTTAMKEWAVGKKNTAVDISNIQGLLTTDTQKSGSGLTSNPGTKGFIGFTDSVSYITKEEEHYPELNVFKNASSWDGYEEIVKNYSLSSTSTVLLDTWDYGLDVATGKLDQPLDKTVYCTVRDLTSGFNLTSKNVTGWQRMATAQNQTETKATTVINGKEYNILDLKYQNGTYLCDELVPGMEWLRVTEGDGDNVTHRRVRVIPTASINAGESVVVTDKYDHSDDVELFYSTALRLDRNIQDISTGIYPDSSSKPGANDITSSQILFMSNEHNTTIATSSSAIDTLFNSNGNDKYKDVDMSYISNGSDNANNSKLYTYIYTVDSISENGEINYDNTPMDISDGSLLASMFNGYTTFKNQNNRYLVTYMWKMSDGRILQDAKLVRRAEVPFDLSLNIYSNTMDNLYTNGAKVYTGSVIATSNIIDNLKDGATSLGKYQFHEAAQTGWKLKNSNDTIKSIKITIEISENEKYVKEITNPTVGTSIPIECVYYRIVYKNSTYFTIPEKINRVYTLNYDENTQVYYLTFDKNKEDTGIDNIYLSDMESNIQVDVVVAHDTSLDKTVTITETTIPSNPQNNQTIYTGDTTNTDEYLILSSISLLGLIVILNLLKKDYLKRSKK